MIDLIDPCRDLGKAKILIEKVSSDVLSGLHRSFLRGSGVEFESLREYQEGDDPRRIDWKASSRRGRLYVKEFAEEKSLRIMFLLDASSSMFVGLEEPEKMKKAIYILSILLGIARKLGDFYSLAILRNGLEKLERFSSGELHLIRLIKLACSIRSVPRTRCNPSAALERILKVIKPRALFVILSDFSGEIEEWCDSLMKLSAWKHHAILIRVIGESDRFIPPPLSIIEDPETGERLLVENPEGLEKLLSEIEKEEIGRLRGTALKLGFGFADYLDDPIPVLAQFMIHRRFAAR